MQDLISPQNQNPSSGPCGAHHRRALSDLTFRVPDELGADDPFAGAGGGPSEGLPDFGSEDDLFYMYLDMEKVGSCSDPSDSDPMRQPKHRQSLSVGGFGYGSGEVRKAMAPEKLAELAVVDPKRVKRILANRQSAARSKERKARYISELERTVQTLQFESTTLCAQLTLLQRDTSGLATENHELKLRLQMMEHQAQLHDALNAALKNEVERLKYATGEAVNRVDTYNMVGLQQFPLDESLLPDHQEQQQFNFHPGIQSPRPHFPRPPQPQCQLSQAQPTFSNHQIFVNQHHDHNRIFVDQNHDHDQILVDQHHDLNLPDTVVPQKEVTKMQELEDIRDGSPVMEPESFSISPCESSTAFRHSS